MFEIESDAGDGRFYVSDLRPTDGAPRDELLVALGWRRDIYEFEYFEATIVDCEENPTSSWIEVAYSRQLGSACVVWFSGVSALEAPDFCSYGWIDCRDLGSDFHDSLFRQSLLQGAPITGYTRNIESYYDRHAHAC